MRAPGYKSSGFFFIQVFSETSTNRRNWTTNISSADQYGKVTHVGFVLLLEVKMESIFSNPTGGKQWPRPMAFLFHHAE